jgi:hypothetical protein
MFTLFRTIGLPATARFELIPFVAAFGIAEIFYKFGSFALELVAFLATWVVFSFLQSLVLGRPR